MPVSPHAPDFVFKPVERVFTDRDPRHALQSRGFSAALIHAVVEAPWPLVSRRHRVHPLVIFVAGFAAGLFFGMFVLTGSAIGIG